MCFQLIEIFFFFYYQQCVSRYEGDLVAKCYFAKHKLVWEVLDGGLKSKIEIQWSDISALKASCSLHKDENLVVVVLCKYLVFSLFNCDFILYSCLIVNHPPMKTLCCFIVQLSRQPLFFKETNPQPRKHTLWQATSDFTDGQASIHK